MAERSSMSLLHLDGIGKIYVSDGSVAVGIRQVTLDFDIGEFVAVTGKSGSGKTTLLNVISGMDTYEEGELYVEGEPTSHFSQSDWEQYREQYISFIFQDYNIIDSFTVLQNVELALSHIENRRERRARALELIERVGLGAFKSHRGSKLSGGQKQRTVIARALAKDSPIILADEPTGNLDSRSAAEIVALLAEIAHEKLVIVVTHSIAELEGYATREVRIFDGGVERDTVLRPVEKKPLPARQEQNGRAQTLRRAAELGAHRFRATPRLSSFLCCLLLLAILGTFFITAFCTTSMEPVGKAPMFHHIPGRVVIVRQDGAPITDAELEALSADTGAASQLHYDALLDHTTAISYHDYEHWRFYSVALAYTNDAAIQADIGRRPTAADEVLLELPIEFQPIYGKEEILRPELSLLSGTVKLKVVGVSYYYDNSRSTGRAVLSQEGFEWLSTMDYLCGGDWSLETAYSLIYTVTDASGKSETLTESYKRISVDPTLTGRSFALRRQIKQNAELLEDAEQYSADLLFTVTEHDRYMGETKNTGYRAAGVTYDPYDNVMLYNPYSYLQGGKEEVKVEVDYDYVDTQSSVADVDVEQVDLYLSPELAGELVAKTRNDSYTQASLFFESDAAAERAIGALRAAGYVGVLSGETYADPDAILGTVITNGLLLLVWVMLVVFLAIFLALCSTRAMASKRSDLAILRSMGISARVIKLSTYVQMLLALLPALASFAVIVTCCYLSPRVNPVIPFMHAPQYALILIGVLLILLIVTFWHNRRMFRESVRKTLKGGDAL